MINIGDKQLADLLSNIFWYFRHIFYFTMQLSRLSSQWMLAHFNKYQPWCTETFSFHQVTMNLSQFVSAIFLAPLQFWCPDISWLAASTDPLMDKRKTIMASGQFFPNTAWLGSMLLITSWNVSALWSGTTPPSSTLPTILNSLYGSRWSQTDWLTDTFPTFSAILLSISSSIPESALTRICSLCWRDFPISGRPSLQMMEGDSLKRNSLLELFTPGWHQSDLKVLTPDLQL